MKATKEARSRVVLAIACSVALTDRAPGQDLIDHWDSKHGARRPDDLFGTGVVLLGDVDQDGWPEVAVASCGYDVSHRDALEGAVFVVSTKDGSFVQQQFGSAKQGRLGWSIDAGADLDGDGVPDYVAGAPQEAGKQVASGRVHVWSGADGHELHVFDGQRSYDDLGRCVVLVDDVDLDGTRDIVAVAPQWDDLAAGVSQCGRGYCWSGRTGALLWTFDGMRPYQAMSSCCPLDDWNGDGVPEVGFGSTGTGTGPLGLGEGQFEVVDGRDGAPLLRLDGEHVNDGFGWCGRTADIDRDGVRDVLIGAPSHSTAAFLAGRLYLYSGATFALLRVVDGEAPNEYLGYQPQRFGELDADGDGWNDLVFGCPNRPCADGKIGVQQIRSGRTGRLLCELRSRPEWTMADAFGTGAAPVGDLTGDGLADLVVGACGGDGQPPSGSEGHAYLFGMKRIFVQCDRLAYYPGDAITLQLRGGRQGSLGLIAAVSIDGAPIFETVAFAPLDAYGELTVSDVADSSLSGLTVEFMGFCQKEGGRGVWTSAVDFVHFR